MTRGLIKLCVTIIISTVLLIGPTKGIDVIGKKCRYRNECSVGIYQYSQDRVMDCVDGFCTCDKGMEMKFDSNLRPRCENHFHALSWFKPNCNATSCKENSECLTHDIKSSHGNRKSCYCKKGFIRVGEKCMKATYRKALERCYVVSEEAYACDVSERSFCKNGKCICFENFHPNANGKCEPIKSFMKSQNLTQYRMKPDEYCREDINCITGLKCSSDFKCQCPRPCTYKKEQEMCDCGKIEPKAIKGPLILGIFLGFIILGFWGLMIKRTITKYAKKKRPSFSSLGRVPDSPTCTNSYPLSPISPSTVSSGVPPIGLSLPNNEATGQNSSSNDPLPPKMGTDASYCPPPSAPMYGIDSNSGTQTPPPPYAPPPPPYSLNPLQGDSTTTSPPYPVNPESSPGRDSALTPNQSLTCHLYGLTPYSSSLGTSNKEERNN